MKKFLLILLTAIIFINAGGVVFASSKKEAAFHGMKRGFGFMVRTRDESVLKPETIKERRRIENKMINTYNDRQELRDMLMQALNEELEDFRNIYSEHKKNKDGKEHLSLECLGELKRIKVLIMSSCK